MVLPESDPLLFGIFEYEKSHFTEEDSKGQNLTVLSRVRRRTELIVTSFEASVPHTTLFQDTGNSGLLISIFSQNKLYSILVAGNLVCGSIISKRLGPGCCPLWVIVGIAVPGANLFVSNRVRPSCPKQHYRIPERQQLPTEVHRPPWASLRLIGPDTRNSPSINTVDLTQVITWEMPALL